MAQELSPIILLENLTSVSNIHVRQLTIACNYLLATLCPLLASMGTCMNAYMHTHMHSHTPQWKKNKSLILLCKANVVIKDKVMNLLTESGFLVRNQDRVNENFTVKTYLYLLNKLNKGNINQVLRVFFFSTLLWLIHICNLYLCFQNYSILQALNHKKHPYLT